MERKVALPLIPYDLNERRSIFAAAFSDLKDSITGHEIRLAEEKNKEHGNASIGAAGSRHLRGTDDPSPSDRDPPPPTSQ